MQAELPLLDAEEDFGIRDELDRCYTPRSLAAAIVEWVAVECLHHPPRVVIEPSVGGGSYVHAIRARFPNARIVGVDLSPRATGLQLVDQAVVGDWPDVAPRLARELQDVDLIIGNPPFTYAAEHWLTGPRYFATAFQALLMPVAYLGVQSWKSTLAQATPEFFRALDGRPWSKKVRETAVYVSPPGVYLDPLTAATTPRHSRLYLPSLSW